jgi:hypothetical protein
MNNPDGPNCVSEREQRQDQAGQPPILCRRNNRIGKMTPSNHRAPAALKNNIDDMNRLLDSVESYTLQWK